MGDHLIAAEQIGQLHAQLDQASIANAALTEQFVAKVAATNAEVADLTQRLAVSSAATEAALANGDPTERQELLTSHYFLSRDLATSQKALADLQVASAEAAATARSSMDVWRVELAAKESELGAAQANLAQSQADSLVLDCDPEDIVDALQAADDLRDSMTRLYTACKMRKQRWLELMPMNIKDIADRDAALKGTKLKPHYPAAEANYDIMDETLPRAPDRQFTPLLIHLITSLDLLVSPPDTWKYSFHTSPWSLMVPALNASGSTFLGLSPPRYWSTFSPLWDHSL
eukprot:gene11413-biopygen11093